MTEPCPCEVYNNPPGVHWSCVIHGTGIAGSVIDRPEFVERIPGQNEDMAVDSQGPPIQPSETEWADPYLDLDALQTLVVSAQATKHYGWPQDYARDVPVLIAEVERLTTENEALRKLDAVDTRVMYGYELGLADGASPLQARIDAALAVCAGMHATFWDLYPGGSLARVRAALTGDTP
jgi:hypothetical protein